MKNNKKTTNSKHIFRIFAHDSENHKYKSIIQVKAKFNELDVQDKAIVLEKLMEWTRQQLNDIHPEQE